MSGLRFYRNVGEVFSKNPLHLRFQSAVDGKLKWLETKLAKDIACILNKFTSIHIATAEIHLTQKIRTDAEGWTDRQLFSFIY